MRRLALIAAVALAACGAPADTTPSTGPVLLKDVQTNIFNVNCTLSSCHSESRKAGGLSLAEGKAEANLLNVDPTLAAAKGKGYKRVVPGDLTRSFLYIKCAAPAGDDGLKMPEGGELSKEKIDQLKRWIEGGAKSS